MKRRVLQSALITHNYFLPMKNKLLNVWHQPVTQLVFVPKRTFYTSYFTILFSLGLMWDPSVLSAQVSGTVFRDYNSNGVKDNTASFNETFVQGIEVKAYSAAGTQVGGTQTTNASGAYSFTGLTLPVRIEFGNFLTSDFSGPLSSQSLSSVQFYSAATTTANLGISYPQQYCQGNPYLISPCYVNNRPTGASGNEVIVKYPNTASGTTSVNTYLAQAQDVGSTWGLAFNKAQQVIYASAFVKRHVALKDNDNNGKEDIGAIYSMTPTGSPALWLDLATLGVDVGLSLMPTIAIRNLPTDKTQAARDSFLFDLTGKIGLGDMDISDDSKLLYVVNLFDKKVYTIDIATKQLVGSGIAVPNACSGGTVRPFGLAYHRNKIYVGAVCDGATSQDTADVKANLYRLDGSTFTNILSFPLSYVKGAAEIGYNNQWYPWRSNFYPMVGAIFPPEYEYIYPQPIFADIQFDTKEELILVFNDRLGHQTGYVNYGTKQTDNLLYTGIVGGDILRAALINGTYVLESNATVGGITTAGAGNNQGPGGGEFYFNEEYQPYHEETVIGGAAIMAGSGLVSVNIFDPFDVFSGGTAWMNNQTGAVDRAYQIFKTSNAATFGKANGLGAVAFLCDAAPLEIGNRVWKDANSNGIQDANESGISGVIVQLYNGATKVGTATTNATGNYYFNKSNVNLGGATEVKPNTAYTLKIASSQFNNTGVAATPLSNLVLTTANAASTGLTGVADNNATAVGGLATIAYTTGNAGENNHTLDFGFKVACPHLVISPSTLPSGTVGTPYSTQISATGGTSPYQFLWYAGTMGVLPTGLSISSSGLISGTPTSVGSFAIKVIATDGSMCPDSLDPVTITINAGCSLSLTTNVSGCYDSNGNATGGSSVATVQAIVDWVNNPSGETINVTCTGATAQSIDPATASKPAILNFEVPANGSTVTVTATFSTTTTCTATQNATAPAGTCLLTPCVAGNTGGTVWRDFNDDGIKDAGETQGIAGVTVKAYDCNGNLVETTTTDYQGQYTFTTLTPSATNKYRIEFSNLPPQYKPTFNGVNGKTDVQIISAATCSADFGANVPANYCQADPPLMINCYVSGAYSSSSGTGHTIVGFPYSIMQDPDGNTNGTTADGNPNASTANSPIYTPARPIPTSIADHNQVGSTWGLAYDRDQKNLFAAAYVKAGTSLGPNGESTGKIFKINNPLGTPVTSDYVDLNVVFGAGTAGTNPHPTATTSFAAIGDAATNAAIGKVGLGDLAISNDNAFLYVVNLADRQLYKIPTSGALNSTTITRFPIPTTGLPTVIDALGTAGTCPNGDMRPFGLGVHPDGSIYVGGVCSAESISAGINAVNNPASYQLTAYVWKFDGTSFSLQLNESLRFDRDGGNGYATFDDFNGAYAGLNTHLDWEPWHDLSSPSVYNSGAVSQNEPMLADISFDEKEDMFLGMRDRAGDIVSYSGGFLSNGDIYKACKNATGWSFEKNANCGGVTTGGANNNQGPGGGEFIYQDIQGDGLINSGTGGVFNLMGRNQVVSTTIDPVYQNSAGTFIFNPSAGGIQIYGTQDGKIKGAFDLYERNDINTFAKAAGVGAIAALCLPAPIEIGNYVWQDTNKNGVQDPCEPTLSNITVSLWKAGVQIASTTTNSSGEYYFSSKYLLSAAWTGTGADTTLLPNMAYEVRIATNQSPLSMLELTTANATTNSGNDQNDSDASLTGGYAVIAFTTSAAGSTNHTYDFGFQCIPPTITNVAANVATCTNGVANSDAAVAVRGIVGMTKYTYGTNGTTGLFALNATVSTLDSIRISGLTNPSVATTYTFRIYGIDTTCYNDTTVVLNPAVCLPCSITATFTQGACNNNSTTAISADDYFMVTVSGVSSTNVGTSGKYEVILNGNALNIGGTAYGTPVTVGGILDFKSDGATTYNLTVRDLDIPTCVTTVFTTAVSASCSAIGCKPIICLPVTVTKF